MGKSNLIFIWKRAPFLRLLLPVVTGIVCQHYADLDARTILLCSGILLTVMCLFNLLPEVSRFRFSWLQGVCITFLLLFFGIFLAWNKDIRNNPSWYRNYYKPESVIKATISEPLVEKENSFKATVVVESVSKDQDFHKTKGKLLVYFEKSSSAKELVYGDQVIFKKAPHEIKNSGNPGSFDFKQYAAFRQLYQQVYLKDAEWVLLPVKKAEGWKHFIFSTRQKVVSIFNIYLGKNNESALAKAILIGYKIDLDRDLVQAYSNAGVVHLIAISGLHVGIIYAVLIWIFGFILFVKRSGLTRILLVTGCLWLFAFLTGASPSVLRATVMFTFILAGNAFEKKSLIYNSMAGSALFLLCFDPYILWDVGFQLSYLAVLGIVIAQKQIASWIEFKNKWMQKAWELAAVSLAAQLFTFPLCFYYFHQLPLLFLFANMVAIPLATFALWGCILLLVFSSIPAVAFLWGKMLFGIIWILNQSVLFFHSIPFGVWTGVYINEWQTLLLFMITAGILFAFLKRNKAAFFITVVCVFLFAVSVTISRWQTFQQRKMVVYNIPRTQAIEFISGRKVFFAGDSVVSQNPLLQQLHIRPSHIFHRIKKDFPATYCGTTGEKFLSFSNKRCLIVDKNHRFSSAEKIDLDYIIVSKNPSVTITDLFKVFNCKTYVFDASNSMRKIEQWKKECEELHLQSHSIPDQGALVVNW